MFFHEEQRNKQLNGKSLDKVERETLVVVHLNEFVEVDT